MVKNIFILIFTFFTLLIYSQEITFQENDNYDARELKQIFDKKSDSLILKSEFTIRQVDIFNKDFMKTIVVNGNITKIDLSILPLGEFIVQARVGRKRIIMYVAKIASLKEEKTEPMPVKSATKEVTYYWIVNEINSGSGSNKSMNLARKTQVTRLIAKHELEEGMKSARCNKLTIYEVYNPSLFMRKQLRNPTYFLSSESKIFNVEPYYISKNLCVEE